METSMSYGPFSMVSGADLLSEFKRNSIIQMDLAGRQRVNSNTQHRNHVRDAEDLACNSLAGKRLLRALSRMRLKRPRFV
jgi:hypothetical protein